MNDQPNLVTTCSFKDKEYLVKMNVINGNSLELCVTDKFTAEDWQCSYDASYIENLTHKTGNFKQFDIFITMLKSGLLKTSDCVSLDLLTFEDLEMLRNRRIIGHNSYTPRSIHTNQLAASSNRRYLILTYTVEFDRIHYPLPMEYCGPPDPKVLQGTIRRLEVEITRLQDQLSKASGQKQTQAIEQISQLKKRIQELTTENRSLKEDVCFLNKTMAKRSGSHQQMELMQNAMRSLEEKVLQEHTHFQRFVRRMREEKSQLINQVEELRSSERSLQTRLHHALRNSVSHWPEPCYHANKANLISSRHPGDGLGSPLLDVEIGAHKTTNKPISKAPKGQPGWGNSLQEQNMQQMNGRLDNVKRKVSLSNMRSIDCLPAATLHHRSSSESSTMSKKHNLSYQTKNKKTRKMVDEISKVGDSRNVLQHKVSNKERERLKVKNPHTRRRSSSESSACSTAVPRIRTKVRGGSRHSSASSTSSRCLPPRQGSRDHPPIQNFRTQNYKATKDLKLGMSDLESRIHALQKLLKNGLTVK